MVSGALCRPSNNVSSWIKSCQLHYSQWAGWKQMFWDKEGAEELVGKVDPSFIAVSSAAKGESVDQLPTLGMLLGLLDGFVVHHSCRP